MLKSDSKAAKTFNQKEIGNAINNALQHSMSPLSLGCAIPEARMRKLREVSTALFAPICELLDEEDSVIRPEEAVVIALAGALYFQLRNVQNTTKIPPMFQTAKKLVGGDECEPKH